MIYHNNKIETHELYNLRIRRSWKDTVLRGWSLKTDKKPNMKENNNKKRKENKYNSTRWDRCELKKIMSYLIVSDYYED